MRRGAGPRAKPGRSGTDLLREAERRPRKGGGEGRSFARGDSKGA